MMVTTGMAAFLTTCSRTMAGAVLPRATAVKNQGMARIEMVACRAVVMTKPTPNAASAQEGSRAADMFPKGLLVADLIYAALDPRIRV